MILITGANGKTGRAIIKALLTKGERLGLSFIEPNKFSK